MADHLRFEVLSNHRFDGNEFEVPVLIDENRDPFHGFTEPLLRAAEIIAPTLESHAGESTLQPLVEKIGALVNGEPVSPESLDSIIFTPEGVIIEGAKGFGSIIAREEATTVAVRGKPEAKLPTDFLLSMLYYWQTLESGK